MERMKPSEYIELAKVTEHKDSGYLEVYDRAFGKLTTGHIIDTCLEVDARARFLDYLKKVTMYGKDGGKFENYKPTMDYDTEHNQDKDKIQNAKIFHGMIGLITEAGELALPLQTLLANGVVDKVNVIEELGDIFWYSAILLDALGSSFEEAWEINIAKLKQRYGDKFTEHSALNRDLTKERKILEGDTNAKKD